MATQNNNQPRSWQPPRYETPEEKARREEREQQSRYLIGTFKQALDEFFTERAEQAKARKETNPLAALLDLS
jgi:hypothetical protein